MKGVSDMKKLKEIKEVVFKGFSLKKLLLTILCSIMVSTFIGFTIAFISVVGAYEMTEFIHYADPQSNIVKQIGEYYQESYEQVIEEEIQTNKNEYGKDYPAEGVMLAVVINLFKSQLVVYTYILTLLIGTVLGIVVYIIFVQKAKGVQMLMETGICFGITLLIMMLINLVYNIIFNMEINKVGNGDGSFGIGVYVYDLYEFNILIPFVGVFILVYVANLIHQKILANKFNEKLNRK